MNQLLAKLFIFLFLYLSVNSKAFSSEKVVSVVSLLDYAPYVFVDKKQPVKGVISTENNTKLVTGYSWDVFIESFLVMGYSIEYTIVPWPRAIRLLEYGRVDLLFPISKSEERLSIYSYSQESVNATDYIIYLPKNTTIKWSGYDSLNGKVIGVKREYHYGKKFESFNNVTKYDVGNISDGFQMLEKGRIDGFIGYQASWDYVLKQKGWEFKFKKTPVLDSNLEYVVSRKGVEKNESLLQVYDDGKRKLIENGKLSELKVKWFGLDKGELIE
jgi:polar amino acid transport system substrate-binding protein